MNTASERPPVQIIYSHTALRGMAAMYVVIYHLLDGAGSHINSKNAFCLFFQWGGLGVDLFFVLSGFILNWVYLSNAAPMNWPSYWKARVARILPLYFLTTLLLIPPSEIYSLIRHGTTYVGKDFFVDLLLNLSLLSGIILGWQGTFNLPAWSISVEWFCYLTAFPLLVYFGRLLAVKSYSLSVLVIMAGIFTCLNVVCRGMAPIPIYQWHWNSSFLVHGLIEFSIGFFICSIYRKISNWKLMSKVGGLVVLVSIAIFLLVRFDFAPEYLLLFALPFLVLFTATNKGLTVNLLKRSPFQWLGERSYSIYLWHYLCLTNGARFLLPHLSDHAYPAIILILILGISELSYRYFECPARDFIRKLGRKANAAGPAF